MSAPPTEEQASDAQHIELGDRVVHRVTALEGIVIGISRWLHSSPTITVQPLLKAADGMPVNSVAFDLSAAQVIEKNALAPNPLVVPRINWF